VDLVDILYGGDGLEYYLESILLNPVASTIPKWQMFRLLKWVLLLNRLVDMDDSLYGDDDIEDDLDSILLTPVASTFPKWRTFKLLWWAQVLNCLVETRYPSMSSFPYKLSSKSTNWFRSCAHLTNLNVHHFGMDEPTVISKSSAQREIPSKSTNLFKSCAHLRNLNVCQIEMVKAKRLRSVQTMLTSSSPTNKISSKYTSQF
jgi:hypothetical protein